MVGNGDLQLFGARFVIVNSCLLQSFYIRDDVSKRCIFECLAWLWLCLERVF